MSERGVFAVDRGIFDHPLFEDKAPLSKREAWLWLLAEAEWRPRQRGRAGSTILLARGQLAHSIRFMAEAWGWHRARVERFLERLKSETMIETEAETGQTVITICKYNDYQRVSLPNKPVAETLTETPPRQDRDKLEDIQTKELKKDNLSETAVSDPSPTRRKRKPYPPEFEQSWRAYPTDPLMSKDKTFAAWSKLDTEDRGKFHASIPAFKAYCRKNPTYRPVHAVRYITDRRFDGFLGDAGDAPTSGPDWTQRLAYARTNHRWSTSEWGPMPGQPGSMVPTDIIQPADGAGWSEWTRSAAA